jgi:hypothetical protein
MGTVTLTDMLLLRKQAINEKAPTGRVHDEYHHRDFPVLLERPEALMEPNFFSVKHGSLLFFEQFTSALLVTNPLWLGRRFYTTEFV